MTHDGKATGMSDTLSDWEADHKEWLGGIVLDAAIWNDDHSAVVAMDLGILRGHVRTMLDRIVAARVAAVSAELTQARTQLAAIEALAGEWEQAEREAEAWFRGAYTGDDCAGMLRAALAVPAPTDTTTEAPTRCGCCDSRLNDGGGCPSGWDCCDKPKEDA